MAFLDNLVGKPEIYADLSVGFALRSADENLPVDLAEADQSLLQSTKALLSSAVPVGFLADEIVRLP